SRKFDLTTTSSDAPAAAWVLLRCRRALTKIRRKRARRSSSPLGAHEEHHDGFSIDARADAGARGNALSESGDRLAQARPELASVYLFGSGHARAHTRWRPDGGGFAAGRTRGHSDVESQRAPGGVLWRSAGRRRDSHSQSAP